MKKHLPYACPVCGGIIHYHRIDDGETIISLEMTSGELLDEIKHESHGSTQVYCSNNKSHVIPIELQTTIIECAEELGY